MNTIKNLWRRVKRLLAPAAAGAACTIAASSGFADTQGYPSTWVTLTNLPATIASDTAIGYPSNYVAFHVNAGLGVQWIWNGTNTATGNTYLYFYPSVDGTNAQSQAWGPLISPTNSVNATNVVIATTNWSQLQLRGYSGMFVTVSNGTTGAINCGGSLTNGASVISPGGFLANRPNQ